MQESKKETRLSLSALYTLSKNGLINEDLMTNWFLNRPKKVNDYADGNRCIETEFISQKIFTIFLLFVSLCASVIVMQWPEENRRNDAIFFICMAGTLSKLLYWYLGSSPFTSDLKKLHRDGFAGYYKLHWNIKELRERAEEILRNRAQTVLRYEDQPEQYQAAEEKRDKFKKAHAIFLKFDLCELKQSVYFEKSAAPVETM
jgi:hypothetical protein